MDSDRLFTRLERQMITLAATNAGECEGLFNNGPRQGWLASFAGSSLSPWPNHWRTSVSRHFGSWPARFGTACRPDGQAVDTALAAGIDSEQLAKLNDLATRHFQVC